MTTAPFWYGKLPTLGDFASRRWPPLLLEAWDAWLSRGIHAHQHSLGSAWIQAYLHSPSWRFVLPAHAIGPAQTHPMAGILMPSVDKVGRYFPLTVGCWLPALPTSLREAQSVCAWLHHTDELAATALHEDWVLSTWERALLQPHSTSQYLPLSMDAACADPAHSLLQAATRTTPPTSWWWCEPGGLPSKRQILSMPSLPSDRQFAQLWQPTRALHF